MFVTSRFLLIWQEDVLVSEIKYKKAKPVFDFNFQNSILKLAILLFIYQKLFWQINVKAVCEIFLVENEVSFQILNSFPCFLSLHLLIWGTNSICQILTAWVNIWF